MSKKDFIALADHLRPAYLRGELTEATLNEIAAFCRAQNDRFNTTLWINYVHGDSGPSGDKVGRDTRRASK